MILADENIHSLIIATLRNAGFEVTSVREMTSGITDERVIDIALRNDWILITQDKALANGYLLTMLKTSQCSFYATLLETLKKLLKRSSGY